MLTKRHEQEPSTIGLESKILTEFDFSGHHFRVLSRTSPFGTFTRFITEDKDGDKHVQILGDLRTTGFFSRRGLWLKRTTFKVTSSNNLKVNNLTAQKQPGHISHIVAETIAQIMINGNVNEWDSSDNLTQKGGAMMYQYIQTNFARQITVAPNGTGYRLTGSN